jgi:hypothetical protein
MAGGPHAATVMCMRCAGRAVRVAQGMETDRYRCDSCGFDYLINWEVFGPPAEPCWPPRPEDRAAVQRMIAGRIDPVSPPVTRGAPAMRLPRFRLRTLIILATIVASTLCAAYSYRNYAYCRSQAKVYALLKERHRRSADSARDLAAIYRHHAKERREVAQSTSAGDERMSILGAARSFEEGATDQERQAERDLAAVEWASTWEQSFYHRSWRPWLPVGPDPPPP